MQTTLPDLPFCTTGMRISDGPRSSVKTSACPHPRTDLRSMKLWTSFTKDIDDVIQVSMAKKGLRGGTRLTVGNIFLVPTLVSNEEKLRSHVSLELNAAVEGVLAALGIDGDFSFPGSGNAALVGDPDFLWVEKGGMQPKLLVELTTPWVADLNELPRALAKSNRDRTVIERQSIDALGQLYSYMNFNNNKYGVLSNWTRAWFLRRVEKDGCKTLEYAGPIELDGSAYSPSMLKALVGMVLLSQKDWFYPSLSFSISPPHSSGERGVGQKNSMDTSQNYSVSPGNGTYPRLDPDFQLCDFESSTARHSGLGSLVRAEFLRVSGKSPLAVMCKTVDIIRHGNELLESELHTYAALSHLQGHAIPRVYGYYNIWGILDLLVLEPVGDAVTEDETITPALRDLMKSSLEHIHSAGYLHGDVARRNFFMKDNTVFMVNLEMSRRCNNEAEKRAEKELVDSL